MFLGEVVTDTFVVRDGNGQATNADALPVVVLYRNGTGTAETVTVTNTGTGVYSYSFTIPAGWDLGDTLSVHISAAVSGVNTLGIKSLGTILYASAPSDNPSINFGTCIAEKTDFQQFLDMQGSFKFYERLAPKCMEAQRFDLKSVLGKDFYAEVIAVVENTGTVLVDTTFTQDSYDSLLPFMKNHVKYSAYVRYLRDSTAILTRYGVVQKKTPHSEIDKDQKKEQIRYYSSLAMDYASEMCDYLDDNSSKYPKWGDNVSVYSPGISFSST